MTAILSVTSDITRQKLAEALLRDSESRLAQAADIAGLGFFEHDHLTNQIYWSDGARTILGMAPEQERSIGGVFASIHPDDREMARDVVAHAHAPTGDGVMSMSHRILRPDGEVRYLSIRSRRSSTTRIRRARRGAPSARCSTSPSRSDPRPSSG